MLPLFGFAKLRHLECECIELSKSRMTIRTKLFSMLASLCEQIQAIKNYYEENERLLLSNLLVSIVNRLKGGEDEIADAFETFEKASVMFANIVGCTRMSAGVPPVVVGVLNQVLRHSAGSQPSAA